MSRHYFRVDGADPETGEESYLVLQADTKPQAERLAREQGLLISSIRVARPEDWADNAPPEAAVETLEPRSPEPPPEPEPFVEGQTVEAVAAPAPVALGNTVAGTSASAPASATAAVVLACAAGALVVGGVLALTLALWPEHAVRNELQQIDARLHELAQTLFGCMLVIGGMIVFVLAGMFYLHGRARG